MAAPIHHPEAGALDYRPLDVEVQTALGVYLPGHPIRVLYSLPDGLRVVCLAHLSERCRTQTIDPERRVNYAGSTDPDSAR